MLMLRPQNITTLHYRTLSLYKCQHAAYTFCLICFALASFLNSQWVVVEFIAQICYIR